MAKVAVRIAYDGEAFRDHKIDVRELAPSMLALADMFAEANHVFNGDEATINVFVTEDFEKQCFDFGLELYQQWTSVKSLLRHDDTLAAKELLELILLASGAAGTTAGTTYAIYKGVVALFRAIRGRKPTNIVRIDRGGRTLFQYQFDEGESVVAEARVHILYQNKNIRGGFHRVLRPILDKSGTNKFVAYRREGDGRQEITSEEARLFDFSPSEDAEPESTGSKTVQAWLRAYSPVYDMSADKWRFWYGKDHHYMDVSDSNIVKIALANGGVLANDRFKVNLEITQTINQKGEVVTKYKVGEVLEFRKGLRQGDMFLDGPDSESNQGSEE